MNTSTTPDSTPRKSVPRWLSLILFTVVWGVLPWAASLLSPRFGWQASHPGFWNLLGLIPLLVGIAGSLWTLFLHFAESREGLDWEPDKTYLLVSGPYAFTRNPMYLFELTLLVGWVLLYGSLAVFISLWIWWAWFNFFQIPQEERTIEARFGQVYHEYKLRVPRWIGKHGR